MALSSEWNTQVPRKLLRRFPSDDVYAAIFVPRGWPGRGRIVTVLLPWRILLDVDNAPSKPLPNESISDWLCRVCHEATHQQCAVFFICATSEHVEIAVDVPAVLLPNYTRVPLERACAGAVGKLN